MCAPIVPRLVFLHIPPISKNWNKCTRQTRTYVLHFLYPHSRRERTRHSAADVEGNIGDGSPFSAAADSAMFDIGQKEATMTIHDLYSSLIPRTSYLRLLRQIWQRQTSSVPPQQKPTDQTMTRLYTLALAVVEQYGLD